MAVGTTVFRIRIELIFRRCWNLVTPSRSFSGFPPNIGRAAYLRLRTYWREPPALGPLLRKAAQRGKSRRHSSEATRRLI